MYPEFLADAKADKNVKAELSFSRALEAEKIHETLYKQAKENLGKESEEYEYYVCPVCGYTHARNAPDVCPVCGTLKGKFIQVK